MPTIANHCMDLPESFYISAGVSRIHNIDSMNPVEVKENDIVFVKTDFVHNGRFQRDILPHIKCKFTLITGISSYSVDHASEEIINNELVKHWFCTNPPTTNSNKIIPLPIGFEEKERVGGNQAMLRKTWDTKVNQNNKRTDLLYLPYHTVGTNPKRDQEIKYLESLDFIYVEEEKLPFDKYLERMGQYKFTICLGGAGHDTHRNYESLLVGSIPIMPQSCVKQIYDFYELPSIFVKDWTEIKWVKLQTDYYNKPFPADKVERFFDIRSHKERILDYAKS